MDRDPAVVGDREHLHSAAAKYRQRILSMTAMFPGLDKATIRRCLLESLKDAPHLRPEVGDAIETPIAMARRIIDEEFPAD